DTRLDAAEKKIRLFEQFLEENIPAGEREMIVTEMGLDPDWSSAYTSNSGQQDAVIRVQLTDQRTLSAQEYAIKLRHQLQRGSRFPDLRVSFDTGGMVSAALNYGASSPIDIQVSGGKPEQADQALELAKQIRNLVTGIRGAADVRILQRRDAPYLVLE